MAHTAYGLTSATENDIVSIHLRSRISRISIDDVNDEVGNDVIYVDVNDDAYLLSNGTMLLNSKRNSFVTHCHITVK